MTLNNHSSVFLYLSSSSSLSFFIFFTPPCPPCRLLQCHIAAMAAENDNDNDAKFMAKNIVQYRRVRRVYGVPFRAGLNLNSTHLFFSPTHTTDIHLYTSRSASAPCRSSSECVTSVWFLSICASKTFSARPDRVFATDILVQTRHGRVLASPCSRSSIGFRPALFPCP